MLVTSYDGGVMSYAGGVMVKPNRPEVGWVLDLAIKRKWPVPINQASMSSTNPTWMDFSPVDLGFMQVILITEMRELLLNGIEMDY